MATCWLLSEKKQATGPLWIAAFYFCRNSTLASWGKVAFLLLVTDLMMPKSENVSKVKCSSHTSTQTERNTVSYPEFLTERSSKNKVYFFIISNGLSEQYREFCKNYQSNDPYMDCYNYSLSNI